ncbi:peptidase U32 family protein [Methanobrevibacter filiformis]|uniref:Putative protease YdcP n=1 Tax=Methanobrevibacter filiformis TaxID=55758 RepID=A0A165ZQ59_9EURY|nr:U32 family peptidase [Methanobrevibacter filiformis]KZX11016.1 putative protease YdcP precursor [Methanobrevibacter filiformis]
MILPELLAPIGSFEQLKIAILSGASSVYLSGKKFGARRYAENLTLNEIKEAVKICHLYNVNVYVTVNTLIKEEELLEVTEYLMELYQIGVDAVLVQDIGIIAIINKIFDDFKIHASTQLNIHNNEGIKWAKEHNIQRVVLPRELNFDEVKEITKFAHKLGIEVEIFIHGALCYSYSGNCLFSSYLGGRSGNRGTCAQPCRKKYKILDNNFDYSLSTKDMSLYENLDDLIAIGVDSLKIEGRMRNNEYLAIVVNSYRNGLNKRKKRFLNLKKSKSNNTKKHKNEYNNYKLDKQDLKNIENLQLVFNRKLSSGHLFEKNSKSLLNPKKPGHVGLFIGQIEEITGNDLKIAIKNDIVNIPERGDGLLIEDKSSKNSYGFDISSNPILKESEDIRTLTIKKIAKFYSNQKNNKSNHKSQKFELSNGDNVYITKRLSFSKYLKELLSDKNPKNIKKSKLNIKLTVDKNNYPMLTGEIKLPNGKSIKHVEKSNFQWEIAKNKPLDTVTLGKQLSKLGDLPFILDDLKIVYNNNLFAPISEINKLRRDFLSKLESLIIATYAPNDMSLFKSKKRYDEFIRQHDFIGIDIKQLKDDLSLDILDSKGIQQNITNKYSLSIYINDLDVLKFLTKNSSACKRIYIEIPPKNLVFKNSSIDISYIVNFIKEAVLTAKGQKYELVWKWSDILHEQIKKSFVKAYGILSKLGISIKIMTGLGNYSDLIKDNLGIYGSKSLNIFNQESISILSDFKLLTLSTELSSKDLSNFMFDYYINQKINYNIDLNSDLLNNSKMPIIEAIVGGNIELLKTKINMFNLYFNNSNSKNLINSKKNKTSKIDKRGEKDKIDKNLFLTDSEGNDYFIKQDIAGNNILVSNKELSLLNCIPYLKSLAIHNFALDCRWKSKNYICNLITYYKIVIEDDFLSEKDINLLNDKMVHSLGIETSKGNFFKGVK